MLDTDCSSDLSRDDDWDGGNEVTGSMIEGGIGEDFDGSEGVRWQDLEEVVPLVGTRRRNVFLWRATQSLEHVELSMDWRVDTVA